MQHDAQPGTNIDDHDDDDTENNESVSKMPLPAHVAKGIQDVMALFSCSNRFSSLAAAPTDAAATPTLDELTAMLSACAAAAAAAADNVQCADRVAAWQTCWCKCWATKLPTESPTYAPTESPTESPTDLPTDAPTESPTVHRTMPILDSKNHLG
jgi:hypothetical protein